MGKRLNIALYVCHLENEFSADIIKGAHAAAIEHDANLFFFP